MKKILSVMLVAICVLLCSCGGEKDEKMKFQSPDVIDGYKAAKYQTYDSPAKENGLGGTKIYVDGIFEKISNDAAIYAMLNDGEHKWSICFGTEPEWTLDDVKEFEGQRVRVFGVYTGFSGKFNVPTVYCIKFTLADTGECHYNMEFAKSIKPTFDGFEDSLTGTISEEYQDNMNEPTETQESQNTVSKEDKGTVEATKADKPANEIPKEVKEPVKTVTMGQMNALKKAQNYLNVMAFSHSGLVEQLEYEGFSNDEAIYGADNCGADWNKQAAKKAENYLDVMSFSKSGLIDQLMFEGFTREQAEYGASAVGY